MAGWNTGAKQNPIPTSARQRETPSGGRSMATPSASSRSAAPDREDAARLPCLITGTPAAATTMAVMLEMSTLCEPSPPVPTTSTAALVSGTRRALASIASASPAISPAVSPLALSATRNPASRMSLASPASTWSITQAVSAAVRSVPASSRPSSAGQLLGCPGASVGGVIWPWSQAEKYLGNSGGNPESTPGRDRAAEHVGHRLGGDQRVQRVHQHRVRLRPGGQPPIVAPLHRDHDRGTVGNLILQLATQPHAPGRLCLAVQDGQVHLPGIHRGQHLGHRSDLEELHPADVRRGPPAHRVGDRFPHLGAVAEHQDRPRGARVPCIASGVAHQAQLPPTSADPAMISGDSGGPAGAKPAPGAAGVADCHQTRDGSCATLSGRER